MHRTDDARHDVIVSLSMDENSSLLDETILNILTNFKKLKEEAFSTQTVGWKRPEHSEINPLTATGYFDIPPPRWPTFLVTLFPILKEGMGLSLLDEFEVQYHVIKK